jgi:hypothetical protein
LIATSSAVLSVATEDAERCAQSGRDCSGYEPGVDVFDVSADFRLAASLPFPELPLPVTDNPNDVTVRWTIADQWARRLLPALPLDPERIAFVAHVELACDSVEECAALELEAVPIADANVATGTPAPCPTGAGQPGCVDEPPPAPEVYAVGQREYYYVLDLAAPGGPAFESWGESRLGASIRRGAAPAFFATPLASEGALAATRLERRTATGDAVPDGNARFMLDRFELAASGEPVALPPVNIPGYAVARLGGNADAERWLSVEPLPGATGLAQLHRLMLRGAGAFIEKTLPLAGTFTGLRAIAMGDTRFGLALGAPTDACGTSQLSAIRLGTVGGAASEPLEVSSSLDLPSDGWLIATSDANRVLLVHRTLYALVELDAQGQLHLVSTRVSDVPLLTEQLIGTSVYGAAIDGSGSRRLDF